MLKPQNRWRSCVLFLVNVCLLLHSPKGEQHPLTVTPPHTDTYDTHHFFMVNRGHEAVGTHMTQPRSSTFQNTGGHTGTCCLNSVSQCLRLHVPLGSSLPRVAGGWIRLPACSGVGAGIHRHYAAAGAKVPLHTSLPLGSDRSPAGPPARGAPSSPDPSAPPSLPSGVERHIHNRRFCWAAVHP